MRCLERRDQPAVLMAGLAFAHVAAWTLFCAIAASGGDIHHDMAEAYTWGMNFELGYFKHPPFWAWVAGAWFAVLPRDDVYFYLLSNVNTALGLVGIYLLLNEVARVARWQAPRYFALVVVASLELVPFYTFQSFKFNANTIFLSIWPWCAYMAVRFGAAPTYGRAIALGALCAAGMLSKYSFAIMLVTLLAMTAWFAPLRRPFERANLHLLALAFTVFLALVTPHLIWLADAHFVSFAYVAHKPSHTPAAQVVAGGQFLLAVLFYFAVNAVYLAMWTAAERDRVDSSERRAFTHLVAFLTLVPIALFCGLGMASGKKFSAVFLIGLVPLAGLTLAMLMPWRLFGPGVFRRLAYAPVAMVLLAVVAAPIAAESTGRGATHDDNYRLLARRIARAWSHDHAAPPDLIAGDKKIAGKVTFYYPQRVRQLDIDREGGHGLVRSPWVARYDHREAAVLVVCRVACNEAVVQRAFGTRIAEERGAHVHTSRHVYELRFVRLRARS